MVGHLREIYIGSERMKPMTRVAEISAIEERGLAGDRYAEGLGSYSKSLGARDVTLIGIESLWDLYGSYGIDLHPSLTRRNLITEGVCLQDLLGVRFSIGEVTLLGLRSCPSCRHLAQMVGIPEILKGLAYTGGIYAKVLTSGMLVTGDQIAVSRGCRLEDQWSE